jgi:hypothetical protein
VRRTIILVVTSLLMLPIALAVGPGLRSLFVRIELLIIGGCGLHAVTHVVARTARRPAKSPLDPARPARPPRRVPPASLTALDRRLRLASVHAGDAHHWVRPLVRAIAADRLESRRGLDLDRVDDPRVAAILGPVAHRLAQPTTRRPENPFAPGISRDDIETAVNRLEAI